MAGAFPNRILGAATIDRLRHGAYKIVLDGKSYRSTEAGSKTPKMLVKDQKKQPRKEVKIHSLKSRPKSLLEHF